MTPDEADTTPQPLLSVVIPALNEADGIENICRRVMATSDSLVAAGLAGVECIVVDDGSNDGTPDLAKGVDGVRVVRHIENRGYGAAIKTGFGAARGELLAFLDADGTYPPEAFATMCTAMLEQGADVVVGARMGHPESGMPRVRKLGNWFFANLVNLVGPGGVSDSASGQRIVTRSALYALYPLPDGLNFTPVMTTRAVHENLKMIEVSIRYQERVGRSKLSVIHDGRRFLTTILWTAMGYNPSRILGLAGLCAVGLAGALGIALIALRATGTTSLGAWGVLAAFGSLVLGVAGVSLLNLGITFNYLVALFHKSPVQQGLLGHPLVPNLDRAFGWAGVAAMGLGTAVASASTALGLQGWDMTRLWLWLLGSAMLFLVGLQLTISWILMRVLEELNQRDSLISAELTAARKMSRNEVGRRDSENAAKENDTRLTGLGAGKERTTLTP